MSSFYESFIRLFKNIRQFSFKKDADVIGDFRKWFKNIIIDTCIDKPESEFCDHSFYDLGVGYNNPKSQPLTHKNLIDRIRMLPFHYRIVYNLSVIDDMELKRISNKLHMTINRVKYFQQNAKKQLQGSIIETVVDPILSQSE